MKEHQLDIVTNDARILLDVFGDREIEEQVSIDMDGGFALRFNGIAKYDAIDAETIFRFAVEITSDVTIAFVANWLYDIAKTRASSLVINGRPVDVAKEMIKAELEQSNEAQAPEE